MTPMTPMTPDLALLHTSPAHIPTFDALLRETAPSLRVAHVVAEDLLADAQRLGTDDAGLVGRVQAAMSGAAADGAALVVCTCSSIGGVAERTPTGGRFAVARIDRAMADRAVGLGPRVRVVATVASTLSPTCELIRESAAARGVDVQFDTCLVADAWPHFLAGDHEAYVQAVAQAVRASTSVGDVDAIVLAQASMAPAVAQLRDLGVEVLASPALGVRAIASFFAR